MQKMCANQLELFRKDHGMSLAAERNIVMLQEARSIAKWLSNLYGEISIDDVRAHSEKHDLKIDFSGNWVGSVFKESCWQFVGFRKATHKNSHARMIRVWKLKQGE